jgi:hypothetical protein
MERVWEELKKIVAQAEQIRSEARAKLKISLGLDNKLLIHPK